MGSIDRFVFRLDRAQLDAVDELLQKTRYLSPQQVTRRQFDHPLLGPMLADIFETVFSGRGVALVRGITRNRYSEEDLERICWGFGTHWGIAAAQNASGDRLGHIRYEKDEPGPRPYRPGHPVKLHTDCHELMGLMNVQRAATGGHTRLASAMAIHNEILASRPDLLPALYRGYFYAHIGTSAPENPVSNYLVPVFSCVDGQVSCGYFRPFITMAAAKLGETLPADLIEALDYFDQIGQRDDISFQFMFEPGEMLVCNNLVILHGRTAFKDSPQHTRHLLRLALAVPDGRPVIPALVERTAEYGLVDV
jgi:hypothetical protein